MNFGTLNVQGDVIVTGNTLDNGMAQNVFLESLESEKTITLSDALTTGAHIGVTLQGGTGTIASNYGTYNNDAPSTYFTADISVLQVGLNGSAAVLETETEGNVYYIHRSWDGTKVTESYQTANCTAIPNSPGDDYTMSVDGGWYVIRGNVSRRFLRVSGNPANLILCDESELSVTRIQIENGYLNIYAQSDHPYMMGKIIADARAYNDYRGSGIGGKADNDGNGGDLTVYGGNITAYGHGQGGAGIGGHRMGKLGGSLTVYGGYVFADGSGWGAGIGGGEDSNGADVTITGGIVEAWAGNDAGHKNGSVIGSEDGDGHRGTLTLGSTMMVHAGSNPNSVSLFTESQRTSACFWRPYAKVEPCTHEGASYTVSGKNPGDTHTLNCAYCQGFTGTHTFDNGICTVCGVKSSVYTVSIYLPEKDGDVFTGKYSTTPQVQNVVAGATITLPSVSDEFVPAGLKLAGWAEGTPGAEEGYYVQQPGDVLHSAGSAYTVSGSVSLKARYESNNITLANASENSSIIFQNDGLTANSVTLADHIFYKDGAWNTICLPFDLTITGTHLDGDGVDVRTLGSSSWENGVLTLNFTAQGAITTLEAGKPYLIKWNNTGGTITPIFSNLKITKDTKAVETDYVSFVGTYDPVDIYQDNKRKTYLYMGADNKLYYSSKSFNVNTCRGYFVLRNGLYVDADGIHKPTDDTPSQARQIMLNFGDNITGIDTIEDVRSNTSDDWYDLQGRRLDGKPTRSGIYI